MRKTMLFAVLLCGLEFTGSAACQPAKYRKTLDQPTKIQGYPCAKGYAWFYAGGQLNKCTVSREITFGEATIPAGSWITLLPNGKPEFAQMSHDAPVLGLQCAGGSVLGPSEGADVAFYPSGKLKACFLVRDQVVQGVPCSHGGFFASMSGNPGVYFYESGKLRQCRLSADFGGRHKGDLFTQAQ